MTKVKIGDITTSCLGKMLDAKKNQGNYEPYLANINVRWGTFDLQNLQKMRFMPDEQERYEVIEGDLIMCEGGEPGRCAVWHSELPNMKIQKALHRIRAKEGTDIDFLYYWFLLAARNHVIDGYFTGSTIKHLPGDKLKIIELNLPDYHTQKNISTILSLLDKKINNNNAICSELESMAKLLYDYWFVQFDFPDENGRPYKSSGGKMVWNEELKREIPEGWNAKTISDVADLVTNSIFPDSNNNYYHYSIPSYDEGKMPKIENGDTIASNKYKVPEKCILVSKLNPQFKRIWFVINADENAICSTEFLPMVPKNDDINYLFGLLNSDEFSIHLRQKASSSTGSRKRIDPENCLAFVFAHNNKIASMFDKKVNAIYKEINEIGAENQQLVSLRDFLLPMLMNGQVKIKP